MEPRGEGSAIEIRECLELVDMTMSMEVASLPVAVSYRGESFRKDAIECENVEEYSHEIGNAGASL